MVTSRKKYRLLSKTTKLAAHHRKVYPLPWRLSSFLSQLRLLESDMKEIVSKLCVECQSTRVYQKRSRASSGRWGEEEGAFAARSMNWARGARERRPTKRWMMMKIWRREKGESSDILMLCHPCCSVPPSRDIKPSHSSTSTEKSRLTAQPAQLDMINNMSICLTMR